MDIKNILLSIPLTWIEITVNMSIIYIIGILT